MAIAGLGTSYAYGEYSYQKTTTKTENYFSGVSNASEKTEESNDSKILGITTIIEEGSSVGYGVRAQYARESTEENPIIQVSTKIGGESVSYKVNINEVDPENASQLEMFALCNYADDKGLTNRGTFGSYQKLKYYSMNAEMNGYCSKLTGRTVFINDKKDWDTIVSRMQEDYLNAGSYKQYQDGTGLLALFDRFEKTSNEETTTNTSNTDYMKMLKEKMDELAEKIKNGETEPSFQIGGKSFTIKEWDKLLEKFDTAEDAIKEAMKEAQEALKQEQAETTSVDTSNTSTDDTNKQDKLHITWYTEEGIYCREQGQIEGYEWTVPFANQEQYDDVMSLLSKYDSDDSVRFASNENFWQQFLAGNIKEEDVATFL